MELKKLEYDLTICKVSTITDIDMDTDFYFYALDPTMGSHHFSESVYEHQAFLKSLLGDEEEETEEETVTEETENKKKS